MSSASVRGAQIFVLPVPWRRRKVEILNLINLRKIRTRGQVTLATKFSKRWAPSVSSKIIVLTHTRRKNIFFKITRRRSYKQRYRSSKSFYRCFSTTSKGNYHLRFALWSKQQSISPMCWRLAETFSPKKNHWRVNSIKKRFLGIILKIMNNLSKIPLTSSIVKIWANLIAHFILPRSVLS